MFGSLGANFADAAVCAVVILICALIVISEIRTRKRMKASGGCGFGCSCGCCSGGCSGCGSHMNKKSSK